MERIFNFFLSLVLAASCAAFGRPANSTARVLRRYPAAIRIPACRVRRRETPVPKRAAGFWSPISPPPELRKLLPSPLNADLFEILPEHPYTAADLDYNSDCRTNTE